MIFPFYLSAWEYARKHKIPIKHIKKKSFTEWEIRIPQSSSPKAQTHAKAESNPEGTLSPEPTSSKLLPPIPLRAGSFREIPR